MTPHKNILVLNGGGSGCLFQYHILQNISRYIPIQSFNLIIGVSAGAFVGALLISGRIHTVSIDEYLPYMFEHKNIMGPVFAPKYTGEGKTLILRRLFGTMRMKDFQLPFAILTSNMHGRERLIRSYDPIDGNILVADVLDATSAAPSYYPPVYIPDIGWLTDGGILENNPIITAYNEILDLFPDQKSKVLCLGTHGRHIPMFRGEKKDMGMLAWYIHGMICILMGTNSTTNTKLVKRLLGIGNYMYIRPKRSYIFDDIGIRTLSSIKQDADEQWNIYKRHILWFLGEYTIQSQTVV